MKLRKYRRLKPYIGGAIGGATLGSLLNKTSEETTPMPVAAGMGALGGIATVAAINGRYNKKRGLGKRAWREINMRYGRYT